MSSECQRQAICRLVGLLPDQRARLSCFGEGHHMRRRHLLGLMAVAPLSAPRLARAGSGSADTVPWHPSRPIRLVVPVAAGGSQDAVARILSRPMSELLGQAVMVENLPGAAGN